MRTHRVPTEDLPNAIKADLGDGDESVYVLVDWLQVSTVEFTRNDATFKSVVIAVMNRMGVATYCPITPECALELAKQLMEHAAALGTAVTKQ